jgi:hypothetical protein
MIREFKYFIKLDYHDMTIVEKFKYFIKIRLLLFLKMVFLGKHWINCIILKRNKIMKQFLINF